jgi:hypothetical protein
MLKGELMTQNHSDDKDKLQAMKKLMAKMKYRYDVLIQIPEFQGELELIFREDDCDI